MALWIVINKNTQKFKMAGSSLKANNCHYNV